MPDRSACRAFVNSVRCILALLSCTATLSAQVPSVGTLPSRAQPMTAIDHAVDSIAEHETLRRGVPGIAVVVVSQGRVVVQRAYGTRDAVSRLPVTLATPFNVASLTKPFTAVVAIKLASAGRLRLDAPATEYLKTLPNQYRAITVRQLMTHTSGIARDLRRDNFDDPSYDEYLRRLGSSTPSARPGERFEYSNTGYTVLGWLLEAATGRPLEALLRDALFDSLAMRQASYRTPIEGNSERAKPHVLEAGQAKPHTYLSGGFGSGGLVLSGADLATFAAALQQGRVLTSTETILAWTASSLADGRVVRFRMFTDSASYGAGWFLATFRGQRLLTHGGAIEGYSSNLYHFPDRRLTIAVIANAKSRNDGTAAVDSVTQALSVFCLAHNACEPQMTVEERAARTGIADANEVFSRAYVGGDTSALRRAYTADAVAMPPSGRLVRGSAAIAALFAAPVNRRRVAHALYTERLIVAGETATDSGTWYDASERDGIVSASSGRYVVTWRRESGRWRMTSDAWWAAPPSGR